MASKRQTKKRNPAPKPSTAELVNGNSLHSTTELEIRRRAYEIFLERGQEPGQELSDWLQAEREVRNGLALSWRMASGRS